MKHGRFGGFASLGMDLALAAFLVAILSMGLSAPARAGSGSEDSDSDETHASKGDEGHHSSELSDEYIPLQLEGFPERPKLLVELGNPYLGTGNIGAGFTLPTGAVWQPTLILFGTLRSAVQSFEQDDFRVTEWANRLDLFANLQLSGSERLVVGFRNLDREGRFTSYIFEPSTNDRAFESLFGDNDAFRDELNGEIQSLFFEGDFGEIFPRLDRKDFGSTDIGFSIGRQPLTFQEGMLINDSIDGLGLTRNTLMPKNTSNFRATLFIGSGDVHRNGIEDPGAEIYALLTSTDIRTSTIDADLAWVTSDDRGDLIGLGVSAVQRIGKVATSFRLLGSYAPDQKNRFATQGALLFSEVSFTPHYSHDLVYFTAFLAVDEFSPVASGPASGGPLGRAGISFAAVGLGNYGAPLPSRAHEVAGGAVGYQKFFGLEKRRQLLTEFGLRVGTSEFVPNEAAATVRYQRAAGRRLVLVWDAFASYREGLRLADDTSGVGGRFELVFKF